MVPCLVRRCPLFTALTVLASIQSGCGGDRFRPPPVIAANHSGAVAIAPAADRFTGRMYLGPPPVRFERSDATSPDAAFANVETSP